MSLAAELEKLQERKASCLQEIALIDRELESVAVTLGVHLKPTTIPRSDAGARHKKTPNGQTWERMEFWLRKQATAKTRREISEGTLFTQSSVDSQLVKHAKQLIHRGTRFGVSESQFADHTADLEGERRGGATENRFTSPDAESLTGAMDTSSALMTIANMPPGAIAPARND